MKIEYQVRPVTRYIVTRWYREPHENGTVSGGCDSKGVFDNEATAYEVASALCYAEQKQCGEPTTIEFSYPPLPECAKPVSDMIRQAVDAQPFI